MRDSSSRLIVSPQLDRGELKLRRVPELAPLTTFRFFAALAIVCYHAAFLRSSYLASGVGFFFILSGFILTYVHPTLGESPEQRTRDYGSFWASRLGRVWPLHLLTLVYVLVVQPFGVLLNKLFGVGLILNLFLLQAWVPIWRVANSFNGVSWSLSAELFFYATFPFLLPWVRRAPLRMVLGSFLLVWLMALVATWILPDRPTVHETSYSVFVLFAPIMNIQKFVLGMALAVVWMSARKTFRPPSYWSWVELICLVVVVLSYPLCFAIANSVLQGHDHYAASVRLQDTLCLPFACLLIWVFAFQAGFVAKILSQSWLVFLGEISFAIYMTHTLLLAGFRAGAAAPLTAAYAFPFAVTLLLLSSFLYLFIERPSRRWIVRRADQMLARRKTPLA